MKKIMTLFGGILSVFCVFLPGPLWASVEYDAKIPQLTFAAQELEAALKESGQDNLQVALVIRPDETSPEAFQIRNVAPAQVWIIGTDAKGAMYGGLEVADLLRMHLPIEDQERIPFVKKRGIKFNIPFDVRTPSYDDSGDAAQNNIETVWDFEFWRAFLDDMARYRYNVLSLWSAHPYPSIIKLEDYPEVALDDVYRIGVDLEPNFRKSGNPGPWGPGYPDLDEPGTMKLVKKISMDEKIEYWQKVFSYAEDRGIEIYLFHWNVFTFGATGKHGITQTQHNPVTIDYLRKSVRQTLLTYPQIKGIGVTAGENADNYTKGEYSIEKFIFNTYGKGMMDVLEQQPDRRIRFIFRQHNSGLGPITEAFGEFPDEFETSFKYAIGHMYSMTRPLLFESRFRDDVEEYGVKCWLNLRNDDIFVLRWGNPDFTREYIQRMPHHLSPGFYMGSDGYVWGREFVAKNPEMAGRLEIDKHWYRFRQWGQLAYNPFLSRDYWESVLEHRFPGIDASLLYNTWAATSEIIPQINRANFAPNDAQISPEGCIDFISDFLTVEEYYFSNSFSPMEGSGILSVKDWGKAIAAGKDPEGITPLQVADNLDGYAATALAALPALRKQTGDNLELKETLNDIEAMAYLGRYYADKMRGAAKLAVFREDVSLKKYHKEAVAHLEDAVEDWKAYAAIASSQYKPQLLARSDYLDWNLILKEVEKEVPAVEREGDYPEIRFANLKDGERFPAGTDLRIEVKATDKDGIRKVKLYLNGLLLKAESREPYVWSSSSDELLKSLKPGMYHLEVLAEDKSGISRQMEIQIAVGDISKTSQADWRNQIHQVILHEGDRIMTGDIFEFPRLECYLTLEEDGKLAFYNGSPDNNGKKIWSSRGKDAPNPHYATLENSQLIVYRGTPEHQETEIFSTRVVSGTGTFVFGISASKKLVVVQEVDGKEKKIVWYNW